MWGGGGGEGLGEGLKSVIFFTKDPNRKKRGGVGVDEWVGRGGGAGVSVVFL